MQQKPSLIDPITLEEGEEDPNADVQMSPASASFELDERPGESLINKYVKFPMYLEVVVQQISDFFKLSDLFTLANTHSLKILNEATRNQILLQIFPLRLRI